jgi:hypothetical protein
MIFTEITSLLNISFIDLIGWIGGLEVLLAYALISDKKVNESSIIYHLLNLSGAVLLIINTIAKGAFPSAFVNFVWVGIAAYSIWKYRRKSNSQF